MAYYISGFCFGPVSADFFYRFAFAICSYHNRGFVFGQLCCPFFLIAHDLEFFLGEENLPPRLRGGRGGGGYVLSTNNVDCVVF